MLKELGDGFEAGEKEEVERLGEPHLLQVHEMLLLTNPAYICVNDPMQLTRYQPSCSDWSQQLLH